MSHEKVGESDEWYTPEYIFNALNVTFDLDVASPPEGPRHVPCNSYFHENSLEEDWEGFVWMNPPYGNEKVKRLWLRKFFDHANGIALLPDRTSSSWFQDFASKADLLLFVSPKIKFERPDGSVGKSPSNGTVLMALGDKAFVALHNAQELGMVVQPIKDDW